MLKELRNQHRTIIQMVFAGFKNNDIAERMEMSPTTVSQIIRSPLGQAYLEGLQDKAQEATLDVRKKLVSLNASALTVLERIMNPAEKAPHSVQLTAAKDVLDRTGYKAPDRLHVDMTMQTKTDQEIEAEILAMQESIAKTYLQSPRDSQVSKNETLDQPETFLFTDEPTEQEAFELDIEEMDSSDQLVNFPPDSNQDDSMDLCSDALISPDQTSEESISLLSSLPTNMFQVS
jgi:predicted transcriptional regulator